MANWFTTELLKWHVSENKRIMPWKGEKDPYKIWISEIILQQTRVLQGISYYNKFINKFPSIYLLAAANDGDVYKLWEGLGYYSRCKNLLFTARYIVSQLDGVFPTTYHDLLALKGVGPYTAAAIASFAYQQPHAVIDGNVFRVLSRFFGQSIPIDSAAGKKYFSNLASQLLYVPDPAAYNQAIMDFGATICKPKIPLCQQCVLQPKCIAYHTGNVNRLPVKEKQLQKRNRWFNYFVFFVGQKLLVSKRPPGDVWENLHEFYLIETDRQIHWQPGEINAWLQQQLGIGDSNGAVVSQVYKQVLTHQIIHGTFIRVYLKQVPPSLKALRPVSFQQLSRLAFPKISSVYLQTLHVGLIPEMQ